MESWNVSRSMLPLPPELVSEFAAAAIHLQPAPYRPEEHVDGEVRTFLKQGHGGERVGGSLSALENRQAQLPTKSCKHVEECYKGPRVTRTTGNNAGLFSSPDNTQFDLVWLLSFLAF